MSWFRRAGCRALVLVVGFTAVGWAGCRSGPATGEVRGKVTFRGKPVTEGTVTLFDPKTGAVAEAQLGQDGSFAVPGKVVVGEYIVMITPAIYMDNSDPKTPPSPMEKKAPNIPAKYRNQTLSPLRADVKEGPNNFEFDMTP